jgi:hypothetical protein
VVPNHPEAGVTIGTKVPPAVVLTSIKTLTVKLLTPAGTR